MRRPAASGLEVRVRMEHVRRVGRRLIHKGVIIDLYEDDMLLPDGRKEVYDFIGHKGAAAMLPVLEPGKIVMVRQYRNALDRFTLEIPAGGLNGRGEPTREAAIRELEEETGYRVEADQVQFLLRIKTTIAFCNENIDVYMAQGLIPSKQHLDDDEYVDVEIHDIEELVEKIYAGEIQDSKTVSALLAYYSRFYQKEK